ncbi:defense protein l(2)34Fc-like [Condylostylus longicornis]|uniref:defense protein l(2)34Fc-like n=1 Tax=Condylostylus longicornis TaxID=2530218 RepID=UPI00244DE901|nr:defense protein l(2)34Fc-like [Condylostylus longicornis]
MIYYILAAIALLTAPVLSYSSGAPTAVCDTLAPQHGGLLSQETNVPYTLTLSSTSVNDVEPISITLKGNSEADVIKGFVIQARVNGKPVGKFEPQGLSQTIDCSAPGDTLTHKKISKDINQIDAKWYPNSGLKGQNVQFVATVVQRGDIFWVQKINESVQVV